MNAANIMGDLRESHYYYDGDVNVFGDLVIANNFEISGDLFVQGNIDIAGDCRAGFVECNGDIDIAGFFTYDHLRCPGKVMVEYGLD